MKDGAFTSVRWLRHTRGVIATPNHPTNVGGDNSVVYMPRHISSGVVINPLSKTATFRLTRLDTVACLMWCDVVANVVILFFSYLDPQRNQSIKKNKMDSPPPPPAPGTDWAGYPHPFFNGDFP